MNEKQQQADPGANRRELLKKAGLLAGAVAASALTAEPVRAQEKKEEGKDGRLPADTSVEKMRLSERELAKLTPAAKKLTKGDLVALGVALGRWPAEGITVERDSAARAQKLTVEDVRSIEAAFTPMAASVGGKAALDVSCCCCTPCCCAAAVIEPSPVVA